jgi:uncharacterized membrane protein YgcG
MSRNLDPATREAAQSATVWPAWVIRLDIKDDPVLVWTGLGQYVPSGTGDAALDGLTFEGIANVGEIGAVVDAREGSQAVTLALAGVDLTDEALRQVVFDERTWQFRDAWLWVVLCDEDGDPIGKPVRIKKGRMDQMNHEEDDGEGRVSVEIESHQAYVGQALGTRYSEQPEVDPTDTSQRFVHDLANKIAGIGDKASVTSGQRFTGGGSGGGSGGGGGGRERPDVVL